MKHGLLPLLFTAALAASDNAQAALSNSFYSNNCVPDSSTQGNAAYNTSGVGIVFKTGTTGTLKFRCPVTFASSTYDVIRVSMSYTDPDGTGTDSRVRVYLNKLPWNSTIATTVKICDSNTSASTSFGILDCDLSSSHAVDLLSEYWADVVIERTNTTLSPKFYSGRALLDPFPN